MTRSDDDDPSFAVSVTSIVVGDPDDEAAGEPGEPGELGESAEAAEPGEPVGSEATEASRIRRRRRYVAGVTVGVVLAMIVALGFVRVPYYRLSPGSLYPTEQLIAVDGVTSYRDEGGQIDFTTVSSRRATVIDAALAWFDPAIELVDADKVDGGNAPDQTRQINLESMDDSKRDAQVAALRKLGYPVEVTGTGALVKGVAPDRPAAGVLNQNDAIVEIDGTPIHLAEEAIKAIGARHPGDVMKLKVESAPGQPAHEVSATLAARNDDPTKPVLGVEIGTRDTQFKLPFSMSIDTRDVGGPSAGLALTLGIIDVLTPGSLSGGKHVATTGTIAPDGTVGRIGGIQQKAYLAQRSGIDLFLVPNEELDDARKYAGNVNVVGVSNLDDALRALADNGGDTGVVAQASAARAPASTTP
jgi:PDZ domain-containing protein